MAAKSHSLGLASLAVSVRTPNTENYGKVIDAVEDVIEPYLMQKGYVARTPRGRVAAPLAYERLGLPSPGGQQTGLFGEK